MSTKLEKTDLSKKLKNTELLNIIIQNLQDLKNDIDIIKREVSNIKNHVYVMRSSFIVEKDRHKLEEEEESYSGWRFFG
tara:strand:- start:1772 stop:2008 length:237 start_codon:yes stop_codon:yes gene_type:complete